MADLRTRPPVIGAAIYLALMLLVIFFQLLPLDMRPVRLPMPDLMLLLTLVFVARRPAQAPVPLIAGLFLLADLLFQRPPGLWAGLVVILTEVLRRRSRGINAMPLAVEWGGVAIGVVAITMAYRMVMAVMIVPLEPLGLTLLQMVMTIIVYPIIAVIAAAVFGLIRTAPGQVDAMGNRL